METKLPEEDKSKITACIDQLKKSLEQDDLEAIKSDTEALVQASHKMAELLYSQQAQQPPPEGGPEASDAEPNKEDKSNDDDIVDADYEEVKNKFLDSTILLNGKTRLLRSSRG